METVMAQILYKLTFGSGKAYIGQTVRKLETRMAQHRTAAKRGSLLPVHCAWRKYGEPEVAVLGDYESPEALHIAEIEAIAENGTLSPGGYNVSFGGETSPAKNPDVASKISASTMGRPSYISAERRKEIMDERWASEEYRAAQSAVLAAKWDEPGYRERMSIARKAAWAKRKSDGWVSRPNEKLRGRKFSDESKAKMSAAAKARGPRPVTDETRAKLSALAKAAWQDPEITEARLDAMRSEEARAKMSEAAVSMHEKRKKS
jgi:hypothetical protein